MKGESPQIRRESNDANMIPVREGLGYSGVATEHDFVKIWGAFILKTLVHTHCPQLIRLSSRIFSSFPIVPSLQMH
jgi:hypothetical protein